MVIFAEKAEILTEKRSTKAGKSSAIPSVISISMVLFMMGLLLVLLLTGKKISDYWREKVEMTFYFKPGADTTEVLRLKAELEVNEKVKSITYIDAQTIAQQQMETLGSDFVSSIGYNPFGPELRINLKSEYAEDANMVELKAKYEANPTLREIGYKNNLLDKINRNVRRIGAILLALCAIFILISIALINGTIRLALYSERFSIKTMQLVGATNWFIIRPFLGRSVKHGIYGSIVAIGLTGLAVYACINFMPELLEMFQWYEYGIIAAILIAFGILLTFASSYFATRKYLKLKIDDLY